MTNGFLIVDSSMNTVLIPLDDKELRRWINKVNTKKIHKHKSFKELGLDVKAFLQKTYKEEEK